MAQRDTSETFSERSKEEKRLSSAHVASLSQLTEMFWQSRAIVDVISNTCEFKKVSTI